MQNTPENVVIRQGALEDLPVVRELDRLLIAYDSQFDPTLDAKWSESAEATAFFSERLSGEGVCWLAECDGVVTGALLGALSDAASYRSPATVAEIETLFVRPEIRGGGLGRRLVEAFTDWAREAGATKFSVRVSATNRDALRFYERAGFAPYDVVLERAGD